MPSCQSRTLAPLVRHTALFLAIFAMLAPAAVAGTELAPDVDDSPDQNDPRLDLLSAWLENEPGGVRFTVKVATIEPNVTDIFYHIGFDMAGASRLAAVQVDGEGRLLSYLGPQGPGSNGEPPEGIANGALDRPSIRPGSPGYATAIIPFEPGARLDNLSAGVSQYQRTRARWADVDFRDTEHAFVVERTVVPSVIGTRALPIAATLLVFGIGLAGGAWFGMRRAAQRGERGRTAMVEEETERKGPRFGLTPKR